MKLKYLEIRQIPSYATENPGRYKAEIEFDGKDGKITLPLDVEISAAILGFVGPALTKFTNQAAKKLEDSIALSLSESKQLPEVAVQAESL